MSFLLQKTKNHSTFLFLIITIFISLNKYFNMISIQHSCLCYNFLLRFNLISIQDSCLCYNFLLPFNLILIQDSCLSYNFQLVLRRDRIAPSSRTNCPSIFCWNPPASSASACTNPRWDTNSNIDF
jgi:hypothetical protein